MVGRIRAFAAHTVVSFLLFAPVVVVGGEAAILLGVPTKFGAAYAVGMFFLWIGARFGDREVWTEPAGARH